MLENSEKTDMNEKDEEQSGFIGRRTCTDNTTIKLAISELGKVLQLFHSGLKIFMTNLYRQ